VGGLIELAVQGLSEEEVVEVVRGLGKYLVMRGVVGEGVMECLQGELGPRRR